MTAEAARAFQQGFQEWTPLAVAEFPTGARERDDNSGAGFEAFYRNGTPQLQEQIEYMLAREQMFESCAPAEQTSLDADRFTRSLP